MLIDLFEKRAAVAAAAAAIFFPPPRHVAKVSQLKYAHTSNCTQAPVQERAKRKKGKKRKEAEEAW